MNGDHTGGAFGGMLKKTTTVDKSTTVNEIQNRQRRDKRQEAKVIHEVKGELINQLPKRSQLSHRACVKVLLHSLDQKTTSKKTHELITCHSY